MSLFPAILQAEESDAAKIAEILKQKETDIVLGSTDAPATLVEYASLSCGHCASFHKNTLPYLEENYIKTGKLKLIFRHFPLNAQALKASILVECLDSSERKQKFLKILFKSLDKWAYQKDFETKLDKIALLGGVNAETYNACKADKDLEKRILDGRLEATNILKVKSTPTLILNGDPIKAESNEALGKLIDSKL